MELPIEPIVDTGDILGDMMKNPMSEEELERMLAESAARADAKIKAWLSQYDDAGRLKPEVARDPGQRVWYVNGPIMFESEEERAASIVKMKKEYGVP